MSCYHPYAAVKRDDGTLRFISGWKTYDELKILEPGAMLLPCGHCIGCKMDYSRRWADRMMLELESNDGKGIFLTLTYDCRHVVDLEGEKLCECTYPEITNTKNCPLNEVCKERCRRSGSLYKPHMQEFMKNLREKLDHYHKDGEDFEKVKVRFYGVGEYGDFENHSHRPHLHIILFGVSPDDFKIKIPVGRNELRQPVWTNPLIASCWPYGNISFGDVSWKSCAYVSRYVNKKVLDPNSDDLLDAYGKNRMFSLMSRKPGIARNYLNNHPDCLDYQNIYVSDQKGAKKIPLPRYFVNQLKRKVDDLSPDKDLYEPDKYDKIMAERAAFAQDNLLSKLSQTDVPFYEYLQKEENEMLERIKALKRNAVSLY